MEQQTISVAKAGLVCKLNTRTTILAATNPKGQYDPQESVFVNLALGSPLLSRFDLILVLLDTRNEDWDRIISSFILENKGYPSKSERLWSMEKMKTYFCLIRNLQPTLSDAGNQVLLRYYQMQRQSDSRNAARTTIRLLESLIRLAEAHARLMFRDTVTLEDAVTVVSVMESSMQGGALLGGVNALHTSFPENPQAQYRRQCELILEKLELQSLLSEELGRLERLQSGSVQQSQPRAAEAEAAPGPSANHPPLSASARPARNRSTHTSPGGGPQESPPAAPPPHLRPEGTSGNHWASHKGGRDDGLEVESQHTEPVSAALGRPGLRTAEDNGTWKENGPGSWEAGQRLSPGAAGASVIPHGEKGEKAEPGAAPSEVAGAAEEPDSVQTHVPRRLPKLQKQEPQGLCTRAPPQPPAPSSSSTPSSGRRRASETPKRKRRQSAQVGELEPDRSEIPGGPVAKLAKFTFKRKSKLTHSSEGQDPVSLSTAKRRVHSSEIPRQRTSKEAAVAGKDPETLPSTSGGRRSSPPQGKVKEPAQQPPEGDGSRERREPGPEKRPTRPGLELGVETGLSHLPGERDGKEEGPCSSRSSRVHAGTLARLANFSFTSPPESTSASVPPEERTSPGPRSPSPPSSTAPGPGRGRASFQLPQSTGKATLPKNSLFTLSELDDEALDFDWDEELKKKP